MVLIPNARHHLHRITSSLLRKKLLSITPTRIPSKQITTHPYNLPPKMGDADDVLLPLRMAVKAQGDVVRQLKADKADAMSIKAAVQELKKRKGALEQKELEMNKSSK